MKASYFELNRCVVVKINIMWYYVLLLIKLQLTILNKITVAVQATVRNVDIRL